MFELLATVIIASLLGSLHCAGMCGAFVAFAVGVDSSQTRRDRLRAQALYHVGRLITYTLLGAIAGSIGQLVNFGGAVAGINQLALYFTSAMIIFFGIASLARIHARFIPRIPAPPILRSLLDSAIKRSATYPPHQRAFIVGLLTTLLPCGWLYSFAVIAGGTTDPAIGALVMASFWLGTVPILAALSLGIQRLAGPFARYVPTTMALLIIAAGIFSLITRAPMQVAQAAVIVPVSYEESAEQARHAADLEPHCCPTSSSTTEQHTSPPPPIQ